MANVGSVRSGDRDFRSGLNESVTSKSLYEDFKLPVIHTDGDGDGAAGTTGENLMLTGRGNMFIMTPIATQTIPFLTWSNSGLDLSSGDDTDGDGWEIHNGVGDRNPFAFTVGTDTPRYASMTLTISDASEFDELAIGFRKQAANQAAIDDYTDFAVLNLNAGANLGDIYIETALNNAATTSTDTTDNWVDAATHTFTVICDSDGSLFGKRRAVYYEIDGAEPTAVPASLYQFDNGDVLMPFLHALQDETGGAATLYLTKVEWGEIGFGFSKQLATQSLSQQVRQIVVD